MGFGHYGVDSKAGQHHGGNRGSVEHHSGYSKHFSNLHHSVSI
jgi:hypothetical protein